TVPARPPMMAPLPAPLPPSATAPPAAPRPAPRRPPITPGLAIRIARSPPVHSGVAATGVTRGATGDAAGRTTACAVPRGRGTVTARGAVAVSCVSAGDRSTYAVVRPVPRAVVPNRDSPIVA